MPPTPDPAATLIPAPPENLCLEYANTLMWRGSLEPTESLHGMEELLAWCRSARSLPTGRIDRLDEWWRGHGATADAAFADAIRIRATIYAVFHACASGGTPAERDLEALNSALATTPERSAVRKSGVGYGWQVAMPEPTATALLTPVLWSAADLLVGRRLDRVRECANPKCLWLFLDDSKSGNRRWCSMSACGNRAKAHRHYLRRKRG